MQKFEYTGFRSKGPPSHFKPARTPHRFRPVSSVNLGRLADILGSGLLAASLGISESQLVKVIQGGPNSSDYLVHIAHRFKETGLPSAWLEQPDAKVRPEFLRDLRKLAGKSQDPSPLRKQNMKKLAGALHGGAAELANLLEMTASSVERVLQGQLPVDNERFNHINPRLMAGGFPDGWLDQPEATTNPAWIAKLHAIASEDEPTERVSRDPHPSRPSEMAIDHDNQPSSTVTTESATAMDETPATNEPTPADDVNLEAPESASGQGTAAVDLGSPTPVPSKKTRRGGRRGRQKADAVAREGVARDADGVETANGSASPTASSPADAASTSDARPAPGGPGASEGAGALKGHKRARKSTEDAPAPTEGEGPAAAASSASRMEVESASGRGARSPISRERSLQRAEALDKLLSTARRGAKVTLWRDLLKLSLPYWGNIRRGLLMLRDELAQDVTKHLGLPDGWLDQPSFPPSTLADWVQDANVPLPVADAKTKTKAETSAGAADASISKDREKPVRKTGKKKVPTPPKSASAATTPSAAPTPAPHPLAGPEPEPAAEAATGASASDAGRKPAAPGADRPGKPARKTRTARKPAESSRKGNTSTAVPFIPTTVDGPASGPASSGEPVGASGASPMPESLPDLSPGQTNVADEAKSSDRNRALPPDAAAPAPAPSVEMKVEAAASDSGTFRWVPSSDPRPREAAGPLIDALSLVLNHLSRTGDFSDDDALRLMAMLANKR